jgi:hypothetical protein
MYLPNPAERVGTIHHEDLTRCSSCHDQVDVAKVDPQGRCSGCQPIDALVGSDEERFAAEGELRGHNYKVTAKQDSRGFTWSLFVDGRFLRSGWTRGSNVQLAYAAARELVGLTQAEAVLR